ncbi:MAG: prepilin-type N-terminal cleavage/methylation domain-containing protein [Clostridia bacterium]|nr:prepilin-type N-terminal cleavage/methylation domain-containing protein [Clostridia bacterium]
MKHKKNKKAFTLIELMIVIVIIGILAAILIPTISNSITKARITEGKSNARSINTMILVEAIFSDVGYFTPEEVEVLMNAKGVDLESNLEGYAYFYDCNTNNVQFLNIGDVIDGSIELSYSGFRTAYADSDNNYTGIEAFASAYPSLCYINHSNNPITNLIATARTLATDNLGNTTNMATSFNNALAALTDDNIKNLSDEQQQAISDALEEYSLDNALYIDDNGMYFTDYSATIKHIVFTKGITTVPAAPNEVTLTIREDVTILLPTSVVFVQKGAFDSINVVNSENAASSSVIKLKASESVSFEENSLGESVNKVVAQMGKIQYETIALGSSTFGVDYTQVETRYMDGTVARATSNVSEAIVDSKSVLSSYLIPTAELSKSLLVEYTSLSLRVLQGTNCIRVVGVAVNSGLQGYKLAGIGCITHADAFTKDVMPTGYAPNIETVDPTNKTANLTVELPDAVKDFVNYHGLTLKVTYKATYTGYSFNYLTGYGSKTWNADATVMDSTNRTYTWTIGSSTNKYTATNIVSGYTFNNNETTVTANGLKVAKIEIVDGTGKVYFVRYFQ